MTYSYQKCNTLMLPESVHVISRYSLIESYSNNIIIDNQTCLIRKMVTMLVTLHNDDYIAGGRSAAAVGCNNLHGRHGIVGEQIVRDEHILARN